MVSDRQYFKNELFDILSVLVYSYASTSGTNASRPALQVMSHNLKSILFF